MKFGFYVNGLTYSPRAGIMSSTLIPMVQQPGEETQSGGSKILLSKSHFISVSLVHNEHLFLIFRLT